MKALLSWLQEFTAIDGPPAALAERCTLARREAGEAVRILAPEACGLYCALRLDRVNVGPSARAIATRLEGLGQRAINNIADLTNYVLWELGQPTHAFDFDKLRGGRIEV